MCIATKVRRYWERGKPVGHGILFFSEFRIASVFAYMCVMHCIYSFVLTEKTLEILHFTCTNSFCLARRFCNGSTACQRYGERHHHQQRPAIASRFYIIEWRSSIFFSILLFFFSVSFLVLKYIYNQRVIVQYWRNTHTKKKV